MVGSLFEAVPFVDGARLPLTRSRVAFMTESRACCGCRARAELGFRPLVDLASGRRRTAEWYRSQGLL